MAKEASSNTVCLLLLNLLVSSIAARPSKDEAANAKITTLPGQPTDASFAQYSGYVTINEKKKLFYWLVEASSDAESKPLLLWLNGGPGASTIGYGAFQEIGPFQILPDGKLSKRQFAWNTEANLLFLDSPAGAGFSILNERAMQDEAFMNEIGDVNNFNLYMRPSASPIQDLMYRDGFGYYSDNDTINYLRRREVQEAFHIDPSYIPVNYTLDSDLVQNSYIESDTESSMLPVLKELVEAHLRIWIYR
ncbi:serine carboxypeptidase-like 34 [Syzygium oleosum]|uniref:serine carboxypeptidase-like 34 n=1 Tax=Syzygium oleosum TaxID=219896 RepID=UPI0024BA5530|nr:serine carboxypeptidase-like 34 [Syzygium oleosum]